MAAMKVIRFLKIQGRGVTAKRWPQTCQWNQGWGAQGPPNFDEALRPELAGMRESLKQKKKRLPKNAQKLTQRQKLKSDDSMTSVQF